MSHKEDETDPFTFTLGLAPLDTSSTAWDWRNTPLPVLVEDEESDDEEWVN